MSTRTPEPTTDDDGTESKAWGADFWVVLFIWVGVVASVVGAVSGVLVAAESRPGQCPSRAFPGEVDPCAIHPDGELGVAIVAISILLGILVVFAGLTARTALRTPRD